MLFFEMKPDPAFREIVDSSLELAYDLLKDLGDDMLDAFSDKIQNISIIALRRFRQLISHPSSLPVTE